jgi:riboflavin kinase/FMN adenylyltransferase
MINVHMKYFFRDSTGTTITPQGSIVGIGSFDGVHLGHRALLTQVSNRAKILGVKSAA